MPDAEDRNRRLWSKELGIVVRDRELKLRFFFAGEIGQGERRVICNRRFGFRSRKAMAEKVGLGESQLKGAKLDPDRLSREAVEALERHLGFDSVWPEWTTGTAEEFALKYNEKFATGGKEADMAPTVRVALTPPITKAIFVETWRRNEEENTHYSNNIGGSIFRSRSQMLDSMIMELTDYCNIKTPIKPDAFAFIARGGYGCGILSLGSDVDVSLIHVNACAEAESYYRTFRSYLSDACGGIKVIRPAPLINTVGDLISSWHNAIEKGNQGKNRAALISFTNIRHISGCRKLYYDVCHAWADFIKERSWRDFCNIADSLHSKLTTDVTTDSEIIDIKNGAGGILEYRHIAFLKKVLSIRGASVSIDPASEASYHFLLEVRDCAYTFSSTHAIHKNKLFDVYNSIIHRGFNYASSNAFARDLLNNRQYIRNEYFRTLSLIDEYISS